MIASSILNHAISHFSLDKINDEIVYQEINNMTAGYYK